MRHKDMTCNYNAKKDVNAGSIENRHVELHYQGRRLLGVSANGKEQRLSEDV